MTTNPIPLFKKHVNGLSRIKGSSQWVGICPNCSNGSKPKKKFYVNETNGLWDCKRCGRKGNAISFAKDHGEDHRPFCDYAAKPRPIVPGAADHFNQVLLGRPDLWRKPWNRRILETLKVGWDRNEKTYTFPIFDSGGDLINFIRHKGWQQRGSKITLYPQNLLSAFDPRYIVLCEGLPDTISLLSNEIQCVTSTGGASGMPNDIAPLGMYERIYICFDNDPTGEQGAEKWINRLVSQFPYTKLRVCDLSEYLEEGGDVTDYLSIPGNNKDTFISEVLERARVGRPYSDVPDFVRQQMLNPAFGIQKPIDQMLYLQIVLRATRYRVLTAEINGMRVHMNPGEYITSVSRLAVILPKYTEKQILTSLSRLVKAGFIEQLDLRKKRGRIISLVGWGSEQQKGQSDSLEMGKLNFPFPPSIVTKRMPENGQANSEKMGSINRV